MTISQDSSAPLIAVVGATGAQGGSVIKALAESDKLYRVRGFTRDAGKTEAQVLANQGVEVVGVDLGVENKDAVFKAFDGATYAFIMSNFRLVKGQEAAEGKLLVDAAKASKVKLFVWSGIPSVSKASGGKYTKGYPYEEKAEVTEYAKSTGIPFVNVQAGGYMQNFLKHMRPTKQADGTFVIATCIAPDAPFPLIDGNNDYGLFVRKALEQPMESGTVIHAYSQMTTLKEVARVLDQVTGKKVVYTQQDEKAFKESALAAGVPPIIVDAMYDARSSISEFGYWGNADIKQNQVGLARSLETWEGFCKKADWSEVLA